MERFHDGQHVWLRNRVHGTYLNANSDGKTISLRNRRASLKAAWTVHIHQGNNGGAYLLLHSAAYGRYLAATDTRAPPINLGFRTKQRDFDQPEVRAIMWRAAEAGFGDAVLLRDVRGRHLRANGKFTGKYLRLTNGVTVDDADKVSNMMYWNVETIPLRDPGLPPPGFAAAIPTSIRQKLSYNLRLEQRVWRLVRFVRASPEGVVNEDDGWVDFHFWGRYVFHLRNELVARVIPHDGHAFVMEVAMSVRAGRYGRLTPLVGNLPHGGTGETLQIVVYVSGTPAYDEQRYPDVYAQ